jgi:hypothetical protein
MGGRAQRRTAFGHEAAMLLGTAGAANPIGAAMKSIALVAAALGLLASPAAAEEGDPRCAMHGEGFIYSEPTGSCIKMSGELSAGFRAGGGGSRLGSEGGLSLDARTETEAGPFRLFVSPKVRSGD